MEDNDLLYNHVRKEELLTLGAYRLLTEELACLRDTTAYRGLSFRTKREYEDFIQLLDSGEYHPAVPESFSTSLVTAESFAKNKKSFFFFNDNIIALENSYKNLTYENISVYAGVVIEIVIPQGEGVDVNRSDCGVEDEIIFSTPDKINYTYKIIDSFETQLKKNPIDINQYILKNDIKDPLSKYIMFNMQEQINPATQMFIATSFFKPLPLVKHINNYHIDNDKNLVASEHNPSFLNTDRIDIKFHFNNIISPYQSGVFTDPNVIKFIKDKLNNIVLEACEFIESEYHYGDREEKIYYDMSNISNIGYLCSEYAQNRILECNFMCTPQTYNEINEDIRALNGREDLTSDEKNNIFRNKTEDIKNFLLNRNNSLPKKEETVALQIEEENNKKNDIIIKIKKIRNS